MALKWFNLKIEPKIDFWDEINKNQSLYFETPAWYFEVIRYSFGNEIDIMFCT
ncbi:hypothetical protein BGP_1568 [Beggiatoa sp. PS]|nr:hypothetical protein BGP_1568 [Beggiatoa sp. PS]